MVELRMDHKANRWVRASQYLSLFLLLCIVAVIAVEVRQNVSANAGLDLDRKTVEATHPSLIQHYRLALLNTYRTPNRGDLHGVFLMENKSEQDMVIPVYLFPKSHQDPIHPKFVEHYVRYHDHWLRLEGGEDGVPVYVTISKHSSIPLDVPLGHFSFQRIPMGSEVRIACGGYHSEPFILGDSEENVKAVPFQLNEKVDKN